MNNYNVLQHPEEETLESNLFDRLGQAFLKWYFKQRSFFRRFVLLIIFVLLADLLENVISGYTSFSYIFNLFCSFSSPTLAKVLAISFLIIFEGSKIICYTMFFVELIRPNGGFNKGLFVALLMQTSLSVFFTYQGSHALVFNNSAPPVLLPASEMQNFYKDQIEAKRASILFIQENSAESIKYVTNNQVTGLENEISALEIKLSNEADSISSNNSTTLVQFEGTKMYNTGEVRTIAIAYNFLSIFIFAPFMAIFLVKSFEDYGFKFPKDKRTITREVPQKEKEEPHHEEWEFEEEEAPRRRPNGRPINGDVLDAEIVGK